MEWLVKLRGRAVSAGAAGASWGEEAAASHGMDVLQRDSSAQESFPKF